MFIAYQNYTGTHVVEMDAPCLRRKGPSGILGSAFIFGDVSGKKHIVEDHEIICITGDCPADIAPAKRDNAIEFTQHSDADYYLQVSVVGQDFRVREQHYVTKACCFGEAEDKVLNHIINDTDGYAEYAHVYAGIDRNNKVFYEYDGKRDYGTFTNYEWKRKYIDDSYVRI